MYVLRGEFPGYSADEFAVQMQPNGAVLVSAPAKPGSGIAAIQQVVQVRASIHTGMCIVPRLTHCLMVPVAKGCFHRAALGRRVP